jgi:hypothetical protein
LLSRGHNVEEVFDVNVNVEVQEVFDVNVNVDAEAFAAARCASCCRLQRVHEWRVALRR